MTAGSMYCSPAIEWFMFRAKRIGGANPQRLQRL
jgi:hypothetical protein